MASDAQLDFLERTGDRTIINTNYTENEHGFASYKIEKNLLHVIQVYGDGKYWESFFRDLAKEKGIKRAMFYTRRNPKAFQRRFKAKTIQTLMVIEAESDG